MHTVNVYAWDTAGNVGVSEAMPFSVEVPKPFPVLPVAVASVIVVTVFGVGILLYFKKLKP
jgi:hypothetical protein